MLDKLNFGDIITIDDYPTQYYRINGFQTNILETEGKPDLTEYWLDLTCAHTGGYTMAFAEDVVFVCKAEDAAAYLADKPAPNVGEAGGIALMSIFGNFGEDYETPVGPPLTPKSKVTIAAERQSKIDALLDERNDVGSTDDFVATLDAEYKQRRLDEIDAQLQELTEGR